RIKDNNPAVHIAVGDVDLVCFRIHHHAGRSAQQFTAVASTGPAGLPDRHQELSLFREFQDMVLMNTSAHPDILLMVDVDAVREAAAAEPDAGIGPLVSVRTAPGPDNIPVGIEFDDGWSRNAAE